MNQIGYLTSILDEEMHDGLATLLLKGCKYTYDGPSLGTELHSMSTLDTIMVCEEYIILLFCKKRIRKI